MKLAIVLSKYVKWIEIHKCNGTCFTKQEMYSMSMLFDVHSVCKYMLKFLKIELHFGWGKNSTNMPINFIGLSNNISKTRPEQLLHLKIFFCSWNFCGWGRKIYGVILMAPFSLWNIVKETNVLIISISMIRTTSNITITLGQN